ncbi:MGH1-like glycoside hydrolase domain-containing protein [Chitinophaga sp. RAB17]|uniref:MGH1-like glycoside hydrolase domain-containing protein n=1 Tax=Chitinophaga sp. RAB17 TaxID=3233049 RepID=UPI003F92885E
MRKWWWLLCCSTLGVKAQQADRQQFTDVLDIKHFVTDTSRVGVSFFSDMGAWHAYALPARTKDYGAFIGPLLMDMDGRWLSNTIAKLHVFEAGKELLPEKGTHHYYPGLIEQSYELTDMAIRLQLIFSSANTAMIQATITNQANRHRELSLEWEGTAALRGQVWQQQDQQLQINGNGHTFYMTYLSADKWKIKSGGSSYSAVKSIRLPAKGIWQETQLQSYREQSGTKDFAAALQQNRQRWNNYLQACFTSDTTQRRLMVKCIMTLITNWRSAAGDLKHDGIFPSASYQGFYGFWAWDSWKQAAAVCVFNPALAKDNIRAMFDYQQADGMVVDCIYTNSKENNARDTKPPLAAWAVWEVFRQTKDTAFIKEMYAPLVRYHHWWYANRDHDGDSLCEYGATDGTRIAAAWESGMDNAVRFDHARMQQNNAHAWSLDQSSVDLNAYLYAEKLYLGKMAVLLHLQDQWTLEATSLKEKINQQYYDAETGFYYDRHTSLVKVAGAEGWIPLWAGIANPQQAASVAAVLKQEKKFNTTVPLPVLSADHPNFDPLKGYWRGPVWLDQFYFAVAGLKAYGYDQLADEFLGKLWQHATGMNDQLPLYENYHPLTGKGLNAPNFSWSAAHTLLLLRE